MNRKDLIDRLQELYKDEDSRVTVNPHAGQKVAIVYPNTYFVGMSNLGLHIIYEEINLRNDSVCERIFLPEKKELEAYDKTKTPLMSVETQRPMHQFDVVAFDVTFEMDYFHIPLMLRHGRVPIMGKDRTEFDPIVIAGGPCATFNPEPFADFIDAFIIGEGEGIVSRVLDIIRDGIWCYVYHRSSPWLWSALSLLYGWILLPRTACTSFRHFERRRRACRKAW